MVLSSEAGPQTALVTPWSAARPLGMVSSGMVRRLLAEHRVVRSGCAQFVDDCAMSNLVATASEVWSRPGALDHQCRTGQVRASPGRLGVVQVRGHRRLFRSDDRGRPLPRRAERADPLVRSSKDVSRMLVELRTQNC